MRFAEDSRRRFLFQRADDICGEARLFETPQPPAIPACAVLIGVSLDEPLIRRTLHAAARPSAA